MINKILGHLFANDRHLGFCGHDFSALALENIVKVALKMSIPTLEEIRGYKGDDIYRWYAGRCSGKPESEITFAERRDAKERVFALAYGGTQ